ncbi:MAG: NADH-quinone oxidoreductase subunit M, partial [Halioglobus sp.]|nr:NADH-quinone oxidoreductase subunit M [Halioglobus sp.]
ITAVIYALWLLQRAFQGAPDEGRQMADFGVREMLAMGLMMIALLWLGLYPQPALDLAQPVLDGLHDIAMQPPPAPLAAAGSAP